MVDFGSFVGTSLRALDVEDHFLLGMILLPSVTVGQGQFELFPVKKERKKKKHTHTKKTVSGKTGPDCRSWKPKESFKV